MQRSEWIKRILGVTIPLASMGTVSAGPPDPKIKKPGNGKTLGQDGARSGKTIAPPRPPMQFGGADRPITVAKSPGGGVVFTAPPPPVRDITFSGGGGKGAALPGAVKALEESGVLKDVQAVNGASVGAMTAALVAAGITAKEMAAAADAPETTAAITEGTGGSMLKMLSKAVENRGSPLTGMGLQQVVGKVLEGTLLARVTEYIEGCQKSGTAPDPVVKDTIEKVGAEGPTFAQMRALSQVIPAIKDLSITGTYTTEKVVNSTDKNTRGQLYVFSADTQPDLPVSVAVHASASFPGAFKPVDIDLEPGWTVTFIDGGVMNNTPTESSIGDAPPLDPIPDKRGMTFVFEGSNSAGAIADKVAPPGGWGAKIIDTLMKSDNSAAEYLLSRDAQAHAEDIVVVPLKFKFKPPGAMFSKSVDMTGTLGGTLNFTPPDDVKTELRTRTEQATNDQIVKSKEDKSYQFASDSQMFMSIGMPDLKALCDGKPPYPGADKAYAFREAVTASIAKLQQVQIPKAPAPISGDLPRLLADLDKLAGDDLDAQGYIGREVHKANLDPVIDAVREGRLDKASKSVAAIAAVSEAVKVHSMADRILKTHVYPKMRDEKVNGASIALLLKVEAILRTAVSYDEIAGALIMALKFYEGKSDVFAGNKMLAHGHAEFCAVLRDELETVNKSIVNA